MNKLIRPALACLLMLPPSFALAATDAECTVDWKKADIKNASVLTESESPRYFAALRVAGKPVADGKLTQAQFLEYCKAGLFTSAKIDTGAPLAGSNSFTETQAMDRAVAAGFSKVTGLKKDNQGVWRGTASDGTKTVNIAIDYKGNVVAK